MDDIVVRYGESFDLSIELEGTDAVTATFYAGKVGETPLIIIPATFDSSGKAYINAPNSTTRIPLGKYKYQVNVTFADGDKRKFPTDDYCDANGLPTFIVRESLDEDEVVS